MGNETWIPISIILSNYVYEPECYPRQCDNIKPFDCIRKQLLDGILRSRNNNTHEEIDKFAWSDCSHKGDNCIIFNYSNYKPSDKFMMARGLASAEAYIEPSGPTDVEVFYKPSKLNLGAKTGQANSLSSAQANEEAFVAWAKSEHTKHEQ